MKNTAEKNGMWKGDEVGYDALHEWIKKRLVKPKLCEICKKIPPYDLANISGEYKRKLNDWEFLCRKCHMKKDGRAKKLGEMASSRKLENIKCLVCGKIFKPKWIETKHCSHKCGGITASKKGVETKKKLGTLSQIALKG